MGGNQWCVRAETGKAEAAKLQDAGISLKQCQKNEAEKRLAYLNWKIGAVSAELCEQLKRNTKDSAVVHHRSGFDDGSRFECSDGERRMAVAMRRSARFECVTAAPWKSPMNGLEHRLRRLLPVADKPDVIAWRLESEVPPSTALFAGNLFIIPADWAGKCYDRFSSAQPTCAAFINISNAPHVFRVSAK